MFLKRIATLGVFACLLIGTSASLQSGAFAQEAERYLTVGITEDEYPILLDTKEVRDTNFKLFTRYGSGIIETSYHASCGETRLFSGKTTIYSARGQTLKQIRDSKEIPFNAESPSGKGMIFVCKKVRALGW